MVSCPPSDVVASVSAPFLDELPELSSTTIIELSSNVYELDDSYVNGEKTMSCMCIYECIYIHTYVHSYVHTYI